MPFTREVRGNDEWSFDTDRGRDEYCHSVAHDLDFAGCLVLPLPEEHMTIRERTAQVPAMLLLHYSPCSDLASVAARTVTAFIRAILGERDLSVGIGSSIRRPMGLRPTGTRTSTCSSNEAAEALVPAAGRLPEHGKYCVGSIELPIPKQYNIRSSLRFLIDYISLRNDSSQ